jgi:hypothetical protein
MLKYITLSSVLVSNGSFLVNDIQCKGTDVSITVANIVTCYVMSLLVDTNLTQSAGSVLTVCSYSSNVRVCECKDVCKM